MAEEVEPLPALEGVGGVRAGLIRRISGVDVLEGRAVVMARLAPIHARILAEAGLGNLPVVTAEQVHGRELATVRHAGGGPIAGVDGLVTTVPGLCLGIYVADCAAVYLVDRRRRGIALVHSGKKGTELDIVSAAVERLCRESGAESGELIAVVSPCIRPPHYETDFAARIAEQLRASGVAEIHDEGICTAEHPDLYYSYRRERGLTGRMLAFLAMGVETAPTQG